MFSGMADIFSIVKMIMERSLQPVIVFSFSKKDCESHALQMSKLDFNTSEEKALVREVFENATDVLSDDDKQLPQVQCKVSVFGLLSDNISGVQLLQFVIWNIWRPRCSFV